MQIVNDGLDAHNLRSIVCRCDAFLITAHSPREGHYTIAVSHSDLLRGNIGICIDLILYFAGDLGITGLVRTFHIGQQRAEPQQD